MSELRISQLQASAGANEILKGLDLVVRQGEVHAIMGPNGSGKSTLASVLMGHPQYEVTGGTVTIDDEDILSLSPDKRARLGIFLAFQYPSELPGVSLSQFLRQAYNAQREEKDQLGVLPFQQMLEEKIAQLKLDPNFLMRGVNEGFSGGEKKKVEILQMAVLQPRFAILDETDSGLDIDALRIVSEGVQQLLGPQLGVLIITHYQRILKYITPDHVHVLAKGKIIRSGDKTLADQLEAEGYDRILREAKV